MKKLKPIGKEQILFEGKTFEIINQPFKAGGKLKNLEIARRSPGVRLIILKNNKILLTKEYRVELKNYDYRLPGGKVFDTLEEYKKALKSKTDILKFAIEAAKKECLEETGLIVKKIKHYHTSHAGQTIVWDLFYFIVYDFEKSRQNLEFGEVIHPEWKTFDEVKDFCFNNKIKEDRSVGILLKFLMSRK